MRDNISGGALTETTFLILLAFCSPNHGYGVMQFIERETGGRVQLGPGTLYGAINSMVSKGWIEEHGEDNGRKKNYVITLCGKEIVNNEISRIEQLYHTAMKITDNGGKLL